MCIKLSLTNPMGIKNKVGAVVVIHESRQLFKIFFSEKLKQPKF